jgi:hypothetical protein
MNTQQRNETSTTKKKAGNPLLIIVALCGALYYGGKMAGLFRLDRDAEGVLDLILIGGLVLIFVATTLRRKESNTSEPTAIREDSNDDHH